MIPRLGPVGAARLQQRMTEHTLVRCRAAVRRAANRTLEVRHEGGTGGLMRRWLGGDIRCLPQGDGTLGERMFRALVTGGSVRTVIVGSDCPALDAGLLERAFAALDDHDLVLGPALDGGYYLIGMHRPRYELFVDLPWGSDRVLALTRARAEVLGLRVACLPTLADVDRPEDLAEWERHRFTPALPAASAATPRDGQKEVWRDESRPAAAPDAAGSEGGRVLPALSVVIPALNEEEQLGATLAALDYAPWQEVVVVDGGSRDDTAAVAREYGARLLVAETGRGCQLNAGAAAAAGTRLLFLHADTRLPAGWDTAALHCLDEPGVAAGCFTLRIDAADPRLRLVETGTELRTRLARLPYGDQGLFMYRRLFAAAGGYPEQPILEDVVLVRRLRRFGRIVQLPLAAHTSARRWRRHGVLRTTLINQRILIGSALGVPPETLAGWYRDPSR
jgi:hypothetical protein